MGKHHGKSGVSVNQLIARIANERADTTPLDMVARALAIPGRPGSHALRDDEEGLQSLSDEEPLGSRTDDGGRG
jgi:hypothetical protein